VIRRRVAVVKAGVVVVRVTIEAHRLSKTYSEAGLSEVEMRARLICRARMLGLPLDSDWKFDGDLRANRSEPPFLMKRRLLLRVHFDGVGCNRAFTTQGNSRAAKVVGEPLAALTRARS
jgi:hypothetical protein